MHDQRGEVGIRRDDAEGIGLFGIEQLHGIHRHGHIGRVLALGVIELLHGPHGVLQQLALPAVQTGLGPVAIGTANIDQAEGGQLGQYLVNHLRGRVVRIDQQGNPGLDIVGHAIS